MLSAGSLSSQANLEGVNQSEIPQDVQELVSQLFDMARRGDTETLAQYIDHGVDANLRNQDGNSLLMIAAYSGHHACVDMLADRGADVNTLNDRGQSPLAGAIFKQEPEVIDSLLRHGADPTAGQPSAIDTARMFGREDLVERLHARGA
ncbi:ankyrin repeat domain-containing protein [Corynebacterium diphtheriae]|nr:ankyrin repeat domain-containing protein [Corynebacterium diphtheriae]SUY75886.1 Ankyrin domain-containing protein [Corynebacterium diphtheriae bv. mitis]CAB0516372.1 ankyrin repeat domain-containing protein [Corynebacterium diphtheriae]CAB0522304.1 ankyrin repeat domain-containing protein [Corynebacterium diphtheriae]CAB0541942.1 ankyrin repeat domain-containing protein [Corynebacterium diphtheriae]CAB0564937.1 ankyrin repeat domain-containing protein [Corynebacterium diphtheriae]